MTDKTTISALDVPRYMGVWYEIARYDHRFEKNMERVTANHSLQDNGKITVVNSGYTPEGKHKQAHARAWMPDKNEPGKLKVSFFLWFASDYFILEMDEHDYSWALIGSSSDKYLWILSRTASLPVSTLERILDKAHSRGYDTSRLIYVKQNI